MEEGRESVNGVALHEVKIKRDDDAG